MIQAFVFIFSILFSSYSLSCTFPIHGSEYDELIKVQKNDTPDSYHLTVPKKINASDSAKIYLSYTKEGSQAFRLAETTEELSFWFSWDVINGDFIASPKKGLTPYIHVVWPGEVCNIIANSKLLTLVK